MNQRGGLSFWVTTVSLYMLAAWFVSGLSSSGFWIFLSAVVVLFLAVAAFRRGRRVVLFGVYLAAGIASTSLLGVELLFQMALGLVKGEIANATYSGYHTGPDGIYRPDPNIGRSLRPSYSRKMYWEGHWWHHETNSDGYRGPRMDRAGAVFLGDSMIYGHGVEAAETVPSRFREFTGLESANLGQHATCPVQDVALFERLGVRLEPRHVFLCCHFNDVAEAGSFYDRDELEKFVAAGVDDVGLPRARRKFGPEPAGVAWFWYHHVAPTLRSKGAWRGFRRLLRTKGLAQAFRSWSDGDPGSTSGSRLFRPDDVTLHRPFSAADANAPENEALLWRANTHAILRIDAACRRIGARLVLFDLGYPYAFSRAIEEFASAHSISFSRAGRVVLERALDGEEVYLARDGHWSPAGCRAIAEELRRFVDARTEDK